MVSTCAGDAAPVGSHSGNRLANGSRRRRVAVDGISIRQPVALRYGYAGPGHLDVHRAAILIPAGLWLMSCAHSRASRGMDVTFAIEPPDRFNPRPLRRLHHRASAASNGWLGESVRFSTDDRRRQPSSNWLPRRIRRSERSHSRPVACRQKYTQPLRDTPQTLVVIPQSVLQDQGAVTLRDALRNTPGITLTAGEGARPR